MSGTGLLFAIFSALVLATIVYAIGVFNRLVALQYHYQNAFAQIEVQLKRRHDLIPNLVETVKGYMSHERETLDAVIHARNQAAGGLENAAARPGDPAAMNALGGAEGALTGAMGRLLALSESYPELRASENMQQLTEELTSTENKVSFTRQEFNDAVTLYNTSKQRFPAVTFSGMIGHSQDAAFLEFDITEAPKVSF